MRLRRFRKCSHCTAARSKLGHYPVSATGWTYSVSQRSSRLAVWRWHSCCSGQVACLVRLFGLAFLSPLVRVILVQLGAGLVCPKGRIGLVWILDPFADLCVEIRCGAMSPLVPVCEYRRWALEIWLFWTGLHLVWFFLRTATTKVDSKMRSLEEPVGPGRPWDMAIFYRPESFGVAWLARYAPGGSGSDWERLRWDWFYLPRLYFP